MAADNLKEVELSLRYRMWEVHPADVAYERGGTDLTSRYAYRTAALGLSQLSRVEHILILDDISDTF